MSDPETIIKILGLMPHPEGGYYKEIYRSEEILRSDALPERYSGQRNFSTSIYYLLKSGQISQFHKIKSDEIWHFYSGSSVIIHCLNKEGYNKAAVGKNIEEGENFQVVIKAGTWFAAEVNDKISYSLIGCTVAPGFDFNDFILASRDELVKDYPVFEDLIKRFTLE